MKKYWGVLIAVAVLALAGCPTPTDPSGPGGPDTRATLSALVLDEGYLTPEFSPAINDYTVNVDSGVASITIAATPAQSEAVIVSGTGNVALALGENVAEIVVQHSDGTTRTYTITVTRLQPGKRLFRAREATQAGTWYDIVASERGSSDTSVVYVDDAIPTTDVSNADAQAIADEFENNIRDVVRDNFGVESDVDSNGKVIILLLDIVDGFSGSGGFVAGYFDPVHMFAKSSQPNSNEADIIFMDVDPLAVGSDGFYSTVAHEFQHLVNFANTFLDDGREQDLWINEGLSLSAEYLYLGAQVDSRIDYYNVDPLETIRYGNTFFVWNGYWESEASPADQLANYSTAYLFFQWLRIHATNGSDIYKEILDSSSRDHEAVLGAVTNRFTPALSTWDEVLSSWFAANFLNADSGVYGYNQEIDTIAWSFENTGGTTWLFSPGEGFAAETSGGSFLDGGGSGPDIRYVGIQTTTNALDRTGDTYAGDFLLIYNSDTNILANDQVGVLPAVTSTPSRLNASVIQASELPVLPDSYPIGVSFSFRDVEPGGFMAKPVESHNQKPTDELGEAVRLGR